MASHPTLLRLLRQRILVFDGAMGTQLQAQGLLDRGKPPELLNIENPVAVVRIHQAYRKAGAKVITTNTFGANPVKLAEFGLSDRLAEINDAGLRLARKGGGGEGLVAGSVGPLGCLLQPLGGFSWDEAVSAFSTQIRALKGVDLLLLETFTDIHELRAAVYAAATEGDAPIIACVAIEGHGSLLTGGDVLSLAAACEDLGVFGLGLNCGLTPRELIEPASRLVGATSLPVLVQANCGLPDGDGMSPENFASACLEIVAAGVHMVGGCCGSGPKHIQELSMRMSGVKPRPFSETPDGPLRLGGRGRTAVISIDGPLSIIGERINPTGRRKFAKRLLRGDLSTVRKDALAQAGAGAHILDVNVGTPGIDEVELLPKAVIEASGAGLPLCIDSTNPAAMEAALKLCPGKALLNSAPAEADRMEAVLELARRYGAAVICLPVDDDHVPDSPQERCRLLEKIVRAADHNRVSRRNLLLDCLTTAIATGGDAVSNTLDTIETVKQQAGLPTVLGVGNISHGMPGRSLLTSTFLAMARARGLDAAIVNPLKEDIADVIAALNALDGANGAPLRFCRRFRENTECKLNTTQAKSPESEQPGRLSNKLRSAVIYGLKTEASKLVEDMLARHDDALDIFQNILVPAMQVVGQKFSNREIFLPGLLASAEAMDKACTPIRKLLRNTRTGDERQSGRIVIATVKGDVHDIGKNIVGLLLSNSGYDVIDLGKDVDCKTIVEAAREHSADIVALSALMTTTMGGMSEVAQALKGAGIQSRLLIGGAVVTADYADSIGAEYAPDAASAVSAAARMIE